MNRALLPEPRARACLARLACLLLICGAAQPVCASMLLPPAVGAADNATMGTRIADPHTPSSALYANPAGLLAFDGITTSGSLGVVFGRTRIEASAPNTYGDESHSLTGVPDAAVSVARGERLRLAAGFYGTTGSVFEFDDDPALGIGRFFSETIIAAFPLGVAYRIDDRLWVGATLEPLFGQLRARFTLGGTEFRYKINGPGLQGAIGAIYRPRERLALGLTVRTPGMVWMDGSMPLGPGRQRIESDVKMPTQVFAGATFEASPRLTVAASVRFADSSGFGDSTIEYEQTPQANTGFVPDSKDEWKFALSAEYEVADRTWVRVGVGNASHVTGSRGASPLVFDGKDTKVSVGLGREVGAWTIDAMLGYSLPFEREIAADAALVLPGSYEAVGGIVMLGLTHRR